ncbi:DUF2567 domain-containing protein [Streptomyces sp. NPDC060194]|uniref:DUF2567 domain-containing protein n=1 Tax=Streptomyces sp. NPDC060194 TaxID=3347069 RepID=UPI003646EB72
MTAPLTPHDQPPHRPWHAQGPGAAGEPEGPGLRAELPEAIVLGLVLALAGVLLGALWFWLAPRVPLVSDGTAVYLKDTEGEQSIGAEGVYFLLALAFGVVSAVAVFLWRRRGGVPLVVALALGGLAGSVVAWQTGIWLGPSSDVVARAKEAGEGVAFDAPLELKAYGAWLAWPVIAMITHLGLTAGFGPRDPEPDPAPQWGKDLPPAD